MDEALTKTEVLDWGESHITLRIWDLLSPKSCAYINNDSSGSGVSFGGTISLIKDYCALYERYKTREWGEKLKRKLQHPLYLKYLLLTGHRRLLVSYISFL